MAIAIALISYMEYQIIEEGRFRYLETNGGDETIMLLHGLFGALSNFSGILDHFGEKYNVVVPMLPIFELPLRKVSLAGLVDHVADFVEMKGFDQVHLLGNSLGGHVSLLYTLAHPDKVRTVSLTGSSGLFENSMGNSFPRRGDYEFIRVRTEGTFYDPKVATKELVDEVFDTVNDRNKAIRVIATAKSAVRHNLSDKLAQITAPTLLIWGKEDSITPPFVGEKFHELIPNSTLHFVDKCGHAPMMEHPVIFNDLLDNFLVQH
ncbi:alpha/beta fold hydrolase [Lewinella cohaerens]|uniref:alpha/beta fold hydrolase n=1 Tax=Lewinella cohaerens TaxID=70995 RepID=UPI00035DE6E9|nr:alpha/beta fold hydrolase [Lewinella cohaerens]